MHCPILRTAWGPRAFLLMSDEGTVPWGCGCHEESLGTHVKWRREEIPSKGKRGQASPEKASMKVDAFLPPGRFCVCVRGCQLKCPLLLWERGQAALTIPLPAFGVTQQMTRCRTFDINIWSCRCGQGKGSGRHLVPALLSGPGLEGPT